MSRFKTNIAKGLAWAAAFILIAVGNGMGLIADPAATTMFTLIPVLAIISLQSGASCHVFGQRGAQ